MSSLTLTAAENQSISKSLYKTAKIWAMKYAESGLAVLPLHSPTSHSSCTCGSPACRSIGKHPRTLKGLHEASSDLKQVSWWWDQWPTANIGLLTGSKLQLVVLDIDKSSGGLESWKEFSAHHKFATTLRAATGGGGFHLYFRSPKPFKNRTGVLPGVDVRADGGYIIAPGSVHSSLKEYTWDGEFSLDRIIDLPDVIETLISKPRKHAPLKSTDKIIPLGSRNSTLTSIAGFFKRQGFPEAGIRKGLLALNEALCERPIDSSEIHSISSSIAKYENNNDMPLTWRDPSFLEKVDLSVLPITPSCLPENLKDWIIDISDRMQVPMDFVAAPVIVSLSSIIGRQIGIYPKQKDDWFVVPNLWGGVIARPGFFKSPAIAEAMRPLDALSDKARLEHEANKIVSKAQEEILKAKIDGLKETIKKVVRKGNDHEIDALKTQMESALRDLESTSVTERRYKTNDATIEKLSCLLNENPNGIMLLRDELSGWLKTLNKSGREGDREFYLEAWNGYGSFTVDRIGRGTLHVPALCLSIFGGLQPGKIEEYVAHASKGSGDDGLLQRFQILMYPDQTKKWKNVDRKPDINAFETATEVFKRLSNLNINLDIVPNKVPGIRFDQHAQDLFNEWRGNLEPRLRNDDTASPIFESHLAKFRSLVPSLSLIFYLVNQSNSRIDSSSLVDEGSLKLALRWASILEAHARKVYSTAIYPHTTSAHKLADKILKKEVKDEDSLRSIYKHHWSLLDTNEKLEGAISILEDAHWIQIETKKGGGRPTECIRINPGIFDPKFQSTLPKI